MDPRILKYEVGQFFKGEFPAMPEAPVLLQADAIRNKVYIWASVFEDRPERQRKLAFFLTGDHVPVGWEHVDSFVVPHGLGPDQVFVGHVFDGGEVEP